MSDAELAALNLAVDFITWLLPTSSRFPQAHRQTITLNLLASALDLHERLEAASVAQGSSRLATLILVVDDLGKVRLYLRMAAKLSWVNQTEYLKTVQLLAELDRHLQTWIKITRGGVQDSAQMSLTSFTVSS